MKSCIVTTNSKDAEDIFTAALIKKYFDIKDIFILPKNDKLTKEWIESNYDKIYVINSFTDIENGIYIPSIKDAINFIKKKNPYLVGDSFLIKDVSDNYLATNIFKKLSTNTAISMAEHLIDSYLIDKRNIKDVMKLQDSNLMNICFRNGAKICYIIDEKKQFIIVANRDSDITFDQELFDTIKNIVPDESYLTTTRKVISYGTNKYSLPIHIIQKCDYNEETIRDILERWYISNKRRQYHR